MGDSGAGDRTGRGVQYPGDSLDAAIDMLVELKGAVGFSAANRQTMVEALGYKSISGASARKIGSLSHYGLVERVGVGSSKISELGRRILLPTDDTDKNRAVVQAALSPSLFQAVYERFKGGSVPGLLANLMTREFGVFHNASQSAAETFKQTMDFAGLLRNGVLVDVTGGDFVERKEGSRKSAQENPSAAVEDSNPDVVVQAGLQRYTIALDGSGRVARIEIPVPVAARDLSRVKKWAEYMGGVLEEADG